MIKLHRPSRTPLFIQPATKVTDLMDRARSSKTKLRLSCDGWNWKNKRKAK